MGFIYHNKSSLSDGSVAKALKKMQGALRVYLSAEKVTASEMAIAVPKGHRLATLEEVADYYRKNKEFGEELDKSGWTRIAQEGLSSSGYKKIEDGGHFSDIGEDEFYLLHKKDRSYHYPGKNPVAVVVDAYIRMGGLLVDAEFRSSALAHVAYVKGMEKKPLEDAKRR